MAKEKKVEGIKLEKCPACNGTGWSNDNTDNCPVCEGKGVKE